MLRVVMADLFNPAGQFQRIDLPDSDVWLLPRMPMILNDVELVDAIIAQTPWRQDDILIFGKRVTQPRLHAWYGDPEAVYTYSGLSNVPLAWTPVLTKIKMDVERVCGAAFNSVLLNLYRDGRDSMGMHADNEPELGATPTIASLSLGATRTFILKHRTRSDIPTCRLALESGSLLLMNGQTQSHWKHGINKQATVVGARLNLTFRLIRPSSGVERNIYF